MPVKRCFKCRQLKPLDAFYRHSMMGDGRLGKCIECAKQDVRSNRARRLAQYREYDRLRYMVNPERRIENARREREARMAGKYRARSEYDPQKNRARRAVANAIRAGRMKRQSCEICGLAAQAHHEDYSKPLDVRWLCSLHHCDRHRELNGQGAEMLSGSVNA